jgi:hypothetical protein
VENKRFENVWLNLNITVLNVIIRIVVMVVNEDQKWRWFENGSYLNESPLPTLSRHPVDN